VGCRVEYWGCVGQARSGSGARESLAAEGIKEEGRIRNVSLEPSRLFTLKIAGKADRADS